MSDTIFALSSGSPPGGLAVIRLSGVGSFNIAERMTGSLPKVGQADYRSFTDPSDNSLIDKGILLVFEAPNSFTGENVVEFHCHGGVATVQRILDVLSQQADCRIAEAGEFTRRAFENGKMDLTALEGLSDLISAQTEGQRKLALDQSTGSLRELYDHWRDELVRIRAMVESSFDFSDEDGVPDDIGSHVWSQVGKLKHDISQHLEQSKQGEIIREGYKVALLGPPNSGKSSLLNALAKRDVAIVTNIAGTTRDVLSISLDIDGFLVIVSDTAGIRNSTDIIEIEGMKRSLAAAEGSDLVFWLQPADEPLTSSGVSNAVLVRSKSDLGDSDFDSSTPSLNTVEPSGLDGFMDFLKTRLSSFNTSFDQPIASRIRHRDLLNSVVTSLNVALDSSTSLELRSEDLRDAADNLGRLSGRIDVEDLLDVIFSEFCVGK